MCKFYDESFAMLYPSRLIPVIVDRGLFVDCGITKSGYLILPLNLLFLSLLGLCVGLGFVGQG